jgi:polyisoprenoid-binding protein YceI
MRRTVFLAAASLVCVLGVSAQQHNIDTQKSTLTIHVGKTGAFSGLGHEHEVRAPIHSGTADTGSHPAVEMHVDARTLRVIDKDDSEKDRAEVQKTMLGSEVLDSERHQEIVFKSTGAEPAGKGRWTLRGNLTLRGQTRPVTVQVTLKDGRYTGKLLDRIAFRLHEPWFLRTLENPPETWCFGPASTLISHTAMLSVRRV